MTYYHGGKKRIGEILASTLVGTSLEVENFDIRGYCEPFCGMLSIYRHVPFLFEQAGLDCLEYLAGDTNESVIEMWKAAQRGWKPPVNCSRKKFEELKGDDSCTALKGYVGHAYTRRGIFFDGYYKHTATTLAAHRKNVKDTASELDDVGFVTGPYTQFSDLRGFVVYCDPPYEGTSCRYYDGKGYRNRLTFDNGAFWDWCRKMSKHNIVFVSEYAAPQDFRRIWPNDTATRKGNVTERLYLAP